MRREWKECDKGTKGERKEGAVHGHTPQNVDNERERERNKGMVGFVNPHFSSFFEVIFFFF